MTLVPALQVEERWDTTKKYFSEFLPQQKTFKTTEKNEKYTRISKCLRDEIKILIQIAFVIDVSAPYMKFLTVFQSEGPLIHNIQ